MAEKRRSSLWVVRVARGHRRLWAAMVVTAATFAVLLLQYGPAQAITWLLVGWDVGAAFYLMTTAAMMARSPVGEIRWHSAAQDEGALGLLAVTVTSAMASLVAIFVVLGSLDKNVSGYALYAGLAIATVVLSWMLIHTIFALHYAYEYYGDDDCAGGLKFPDDERPDYWDFVYFSFVIGLTFQVSDVAVTNKILRRMVVIHGLLSFFYTTAIIALTVNMASNVVQR